MPLLRVLVFLSFLGTAMPHAATAQEFRIYTRVRVVPPNGESTPDIIARSLTLFHAGRVYDYIDEAGEVIVLEPAHRRYTIVDLKRNLTTTIDFDELNNLLKVARREADSAATKLEGEVKPVSKESAKLLRFQLDPEFEERFDAARSTLSLSSPLIRYDAKCSDGVAPEVVDAWAKYADAMCRLNFVLHPSALLPEPRQALNASLAQRRLVPTEVELTIFSQPRLQLRAEHEINWVLDAKDRSNIHHWETVMKGKTTKNVNLHEYQRLVAGSPAKRKER